MSDPRDAVTALLYTYAERIDRGDFAGVAELFADGAIHDGEGNPVAAGRDEVLALYERSTRRYEDGTPRTQHLVSNVIVEVDGPRATARSRYTVLQAPPGAGAIVPVVAGRYVDDFVLDGGAWRFERRAMHVDLVGDLSHHLLFALRADAPGD